MIEMIGTPWEPVLGRDDHHIPVDIVDNGDSMGSESENDDNPTDKIDDEEDDQVYKSTTDKSHVFKKAIRKFGETKGCAACATITERGDQPGRIDKHHSEECRQRILRAMSTDPEYRHMVKRHHESKAMGAGSADGRLDNINTNITTNTTREREPDTKETTTTTHDKEEIVKMCANVKTAIAYVQERIQKTKGEITRRTKGCLSNQLNDTMLNMMVKQMQVAEAYSPPRVELNCCATSVAPILIQLFIKSLMVLCLIISISLS